MPNQTESSNWYDVIVRRLELALGLFIAAAAASFIVTIRERPVFQSSATLLVNSDKPSADAGVIFGTQAGLLSRRPNLANHIEVIRSHTLAQMVLDTLPAELLSQLPRRGADPAAALSREVSARPVRDADMIRLSVRAPTPELARALTLAYLDAYQAFTLERSRADISAVKVFVRSQLDVVAARLDSIESALEDYKRTNRVTDISEETRALIDRQAQLLGLYERTRAERSGREEQLRLLLRTLGAEGQEAQPALNALAAPAAAGLRDELVRLESERTSLLVQGYTDSSPRVVAISRRTQALKERLQTAVAALLAAAEPAAGLAGPADVASRIGETQAELVRLEASERSLSGVVADCDNRLSQLPQRERQLARLARDVEVDRQVHSLLAQRYEETRIQEAGRLSSVTIVDPPLAGRKVKPSLHQGLLLALAIGLSVAFAGAWCVDRFDTRVHRLEDLERQGATCIAAIPRVEETLPPTPDDANRAVAGPISVRLPDSVAAEAFRVLRTNVQFAAAATDTRLRTMIVTSADASEGKTTVAANLAVVLAQSGSRVLLVDADLRKPRQHSLFRQRKKPGLTDAVMLGTPQEQAVRPSLVAGLDLLFAGTTPPSPVDFLNSAALASYLKRLGDSYDCIVVDTPPVLVSADAAILASRVDGVLLVARIGKTDLRSLAEARRLLDQAGSRLLGVVANEQRPRRGYGYYRYRYRYHYRYRTTGQSVV